MLDWRYYGTCTIAVFFGFLLRVVQEKRRDRKVNIKVQAIISIVVSYVAFLLYRDKKIAICSIELWLWAWSYFGSLSLTIADHIFKLYLLTLAKKYNEDPDKKVNNDTANLE